MIQKLTTLVLLGALVGVLVNPPLAQAQDFDTIIAQAAAVNERYVDQVNSALAAPDLATLQARTRTALATGDQLIALLSSAEAAAVDDAQRSRAEGLLDHIEAAQAAGRRALSATTLGEAQSAVDAMRGEAVEALSEIRPFARPPVAPPTALPVSGGASPAALSAVAALGLLVAAAGLGLRRLRAA